MHTHTYVPPHNEGFKGTLHLFSVHLFDLQSYPNCIYPPLIFFATLSHLPTLKNWLKLIKTNRGVSTCNRIFLCFQQPRGQSPQALLISPSSEGQSHLPSSPCVQNDAGTIHKRFHVVTPRACLGQGWTKDGLQNLLWGSDQAHSTRRLIRVMSGLRQESTHGES